MKIKIAQALAAAGWGGIDTTSFERGVGGREGALIRLSREWARAGHEVTNFVPTTTPERVYEGDGFYEFVPYSMAKTMFATFPYYAIVAWDCPDVFADQRVIEMNPVRLVEMQLAHMDLAGMNATAEFATGVVGLSQWHVDFMAHQGIEGPFYVLPNGVDLEFYPYRERKGIPRRHEFFYSSSPDRGLLHLLRLWPHITRLLPGSELKVAYGVKEYISQMMWSHRKEGEMAVEISALMRQPGIVDVGRISQRELAKIQRSSTMMVYPCDTIAPTETGCISIIESMAAGVPVLTTDCDCLGDEFGEAAMIHPLPFEPSDFLDSILGVFADKRVYVEMSARGRAFAERRQWNLIAPQWMQLFEQHRSQS